MMRNMALFTDFYSLTMAQGYWKANRSEQAVFDLFFRRQPFDGGYSIFCGLGTLLELLKDLSFSKDDTAWLKSTGIFEEGFIEYLENFRFNGSLWAMDEGTVVFPNEPMLRVEGNLVEAQLLEGMLLNIVNFQSLIATKACRVCLAAGKSSVMEFGLRRAQGPDGALSASRAAYVGGVSGTSNTLAGKVFGIPVTGTMAHSWVMSFEDEEEAFDSYAKVYPESTTFLLDTYDTLKSGVGNAIKAGKKLAALGKKFSVRLDSGDIQYLSAEVRKRLDEAGLKNAAISVSNELDEYIIETLVKEGAPVDYWGVGTKLATGGRDSAFTGVYKLAALKKNGKIIPVMKLSDNPEKTTNPGIKQVWRVKDSAGASVADILGLDESGQAGENAQPGETADEIRPGLRCAFWHPSGDYRHFYHTIEKIEALLKPRLINGTLAGELPSLKQIRAGVAEGLKCFDSTYKRLLNPHVYKVSITEKLRGLKLDLIQKHLGNSDRFF